MQFRAGNERAIFSSVGGRDDHYARLFSAVLLCTKGKFFVDGCVGRNISATNLSVWQRSLNYAELNKHTKSNAVLPML
jgi:hypothetical protein